MIKIMPNVLAGGVGVIDGVLLSNDIDKARANMDGSAIEGEFPWSTMFEAAAFIGGAGLDLMRWSPDITEPLMYGGIALLGSRGGRMATKSNLLGAGGAMAEAIPVHQGAGYWGGRVRAVSPPAAHVTTEAHPVHARSPEDWIGA